MENFISRFNDYFEIVPATTPALIEECQHLRYEVFCAEKGFFKGRNQWQKEQDEYDSRSVHALLKHRFSGEYAATVRLILPDFEKKHFNFPLEDQLKITKNEEQHFLQTIPRHQLAEISRFSVSKTFRRRVGEQTLEHGISQRFGSEFNFRGRRFDSFITLGLFKAIVSMSADHEISYWCAFMEPGLIRLLNRVGIRFQPVGEKVSYYGERYTCYEKAYYVLKGIKSVKPEIWQFITEEGKNTLQPAFDFA